MKSRYVLLSHGDGERCWDLNDKLFRALEAYGFNNFVIEELSIPCIKKKCNKAIIMIQTENDYDRLMRTVVMETKASFYIYSSMIEVVQIHQEILRHSRIRSFVSTGIQATPDVRNVIVDASPEYTVANTQTELLNGRKDAQVQTETKNFPIFKSSSQRANEINNNDDEDDIIVLKEVIKTPATNNPKEVKIESESIATATPTTGNTAPIVPKQEIKEENVSMMGNEADQVEQNAAEENAEAAEMAQEVPPVVNQNPSQVTRSAEAPSVVQETPQRDQIIQISPQVVQNVVVNTVPLPITQDSANLSLKCAGDSSITSIDEKSLLEPPRKKRRTMSTAHCLKCNIKFQYESKDEIYEHLLDSHVEICRWKCEDCLCRFKLAKEADDHRRKEHEWVGNGKHQHNKKVIEDKLSETFIQVLHDACMAAFPQEFENKVAPRMDEVIKDLTHGAEQSAFPQ